MLEFNPYFRWSPSECLRSPVLDSIRRPQLEKPAPIKLKLMVDQDDSFDYDASKSHKFSKQDYLREIVKEARELNEIRSQNLQAFLAQ